jgi:hypothetical protein
MANKDNVRRRITVADPEAWDDPAEGCVSRAVSARPRPS